MTHPLSLRQYGMAAVAMLDADPSATVEDVAERIGISKETVGRYWKEAHPGVRRNSRQSNAQRLCEAVYARIIEPTTAADLLRDVRARIPGTHERTLYRALKQLVEDGRVVRSGKLGSGALYQRSKP